MKDDRREERLRALLRAQDGMLSVRQAEDAGLTPAAIAGRVRAGQLLRDLSGVLRAADHPVTPRSRIRAAMLSLGDEATLVGRSGAYWWRIIDVAPAEIQVAVPHGSRPRRRPGVRIVRRAADPVDRVIVDGVAVTKKPAMVLTAATSSGLVAGASCACRSDKSIMLRQTPEDRAPRVQAPSA